MTPFIVFYREIISRSGEEREVLRAEEDETGGGALSSLSCGLTSPELEGWPSWTSSMMDCWSNCCPGEKHLDRILSDGKFPKKKRSSERKVSVSDIQEWSLQMRENKLILDEFNVRKKQNKIQKLIGFSVKEKEETNDLTSAQKETLDLNKEKDDHLNKIEKELIVREKSIRDTERLLDEMLTFYESSFEFEIEDKE